MHRSHCLLAALLVLTFWVGLLRADAAPEPATHPVRPTLWIIGDSTVRNGTRGQQGWGDPVRTLFDESRLRIENRARGGRSSRTFLTEGLWTDILKELRPGDFVLMQFGHNDGGPLNDERARGSIRGTGDQTEQITRPDGTKEVVHTYGWYLRKYIADAREKGATPVVLSYVPRCPRPGAKPIDLKAPLSGYALHARESAEAEKAVFVDLYSLVLVHYAPLSPEKIKSDYFCETDFTHTNPAGARLNAQCVADGLRRQPDCKLSAYLLTPAADQSPSDVRPPGSASSPPAAGLTGQ